VGVGAGAAGLVLLAGLVLVLVVVRVRGRPGPSTQGPGVQQPAGGDEGKPAAQGVPLSGGKVVFSEPLLPLPPAPEKWEQPAAPPEVSFAAFALLPDVSAQDALGGATPGPWEGKPDPAENPPAPGPVRPGAPGEPVPRTR
jgi:hypothetical protein